MHDVLVTIHVWSSALFTVVAIVLVFLVVKGLILKDDYKKMHLYFEYAYIGLLYLGLFLGIILYFFVHKTEDLSNIPMHELQKKQSSQFWAIEHFSVMIFALLIAQIGKLLSSKAVTNSQKFKYALFYYGSATFIVVVSMVIYLYYRLNS